MPTRFSTLLDSARDVDGMLVLDVPPDWMQGRSAFGGLQAALAVRAMRALVPGARLRTLQATFVAPAAGLLRVRAQVLRTGQSATHVEARIVTPSPDGDATVALIVGVFGAARPSEVTVCPSPPTILGAPSFELSYLPGMPAFIQHFAARWLRGAPPFTGTTETHHIVELDMHDEGPATEGHVLAFADMIPPLALTHLRSPANGSTLTWMLEMVTDRFDELGLSRWMIDAQLLAARDGYTSQAVSIWGPGAQLVALSRQTMLVFG